MFASVLLGILVCVVVLFGKVLEWEVEVWCTLLVEPLLLMKSRNDSQLFCSDAEYSERTGGPDFPSGLASANPASS